MLELFIDGASAGNPGPSGVGIFIRGEGHRIHIAEPIEPTDNHLAEFIALRIALHEAKQLNTTFVRVYSDSQVVVDSFQRGKTKNKRFRPILHEILTLADQFDYCFVDWIPEKQNKAADQLARRAIHLTERHVRKQ